MAAVIWKNAPDAHDYPAASQYLSLLVGDPTLREELVAQLQAAPVAHYKAKDLLRASQLALLTSDNAHVMADLRKIRKGRPLSPVLLVRGDATARQPLDAASSTAQPAADAQAQPISAVQDSWRASGAATTVAIPKAAAGHSGASSIRCRRWPKKGAAVPSCRCCLAGACAPR